MPAHEVASLWRAIDVLEAQEQIVLTRALMFPHLTKSARAEREKKLYAAAYPKHIYKRETRDAKFLLSKLGGTNGRR